MTRHLGYIQMPTPKQKDPLLSHSILKRENNNYKAGLNILFRRNQLEIETRSRRTVLRASSLPVKRRMVLGGARYLSCEALQRLPLCLWDQQASKDTAEHEERIDFHDMVDPRRSSRAFRTSHSATRAERTDKDLSDDSSDLARGCGDTVRAGPVACREAFTRDDEGRGVGAEVEEELSDHVESEQATGADLVVCEADDAEKNREDREAGNLNGLAADCVDGGDSDPVA